MNLQVPVNARNYITSIEKYLPPPHVWRERLRVHINILFVISLFLSFSLMQMFIG
jgi:hypothetical protein